MSEEQAIPPPQIANRSELRTYSMAKFRKLARKEAKGWLFDGVMPSSGIMLVVGLPLVGKTTVIAVLAGAMSGSGVIAGRKVRRGSMIFAALEHRKSDIVDAFDAAANEAGAPTPNVRFVLKLDLDDAADVDDLARLAKRWSASVIVIDPFRGSTKIDENRADEVRKYGEILRRLAGNGERLVIVVHHLGKSGDTPRGSTDFTAMADGWIRLSRSRDVLTLKAHHHGAEELTLKLRVQRGPNSLALVEDASAAAEPEVSDALRTAVLDVVSAAGGLTLRDVRQRVHAKGVVHAGNEAVDRAVKDLAAELLITNAGTPKKHRWVGTK